MDGPVESGTLLRVTSENRLSLVDKRFEISNLELMKDLASVVQFLFNKDQIAKE